MAYFFGYNISPKQESILKLLFHYRGLTVNHIIEEMYPEPNRKNRSTYLTVYQYLRDLEKQKLVRKASLHPESRQLLYHLSPEGLSLTCSLLNIQPNHWGTGYGDNYGDFPYDLYAPPLQRIQHHFLLVELFMTLNRLKDTYPEANIDYRDNRYASESYTALDDSEGADGKEKKYDFRPDGELLLNGKSYYIEIDRGTEFLTSLKSKFENYYRYFAYLRKNERPLPEGILFLSKYSPNSASAYINRRWQTITNAFFSKMGEFSLDVNLIGGTIDDINSVIEQETYREDYFKHLLKNVQSLIEDSQYQQYGTGLFKLDSKLIPWDIAYITLTKLTEEHHRLYVYEQLNGYETRGAARALYLEPWLKESRHKIKPLSNVKEIIPVFFYPKFSPVYPSIESDAEILNRSLQLSYELTWTTPKGKLIEGHPLL